MAIKKMRFSGTLPDGSETRSTTRYTREWRALARAVEAQLPGWKAYAYEPGIAFRTPHGSESLHVDVCLALARKGGARGDR